MCTQQVLCGAKKTHARKDDDHTAPSLGLSESAERDPPAATPRPLASANRRWAEAAVDSGSPASGASESWEEDGGEPLQAGAAEAVRQRFKSWRGMPLACFLASKPAGSAVPRRGPS